MEELEATQSIHHHTHQENNIAYDTAIINMSDVPHPRHPDHQSGISDDAAVAEHDLIARAEEEEERMHPDSGNAAPATGVDTKATGDKKDGPLDKIKNALHMNK
ncbi:hypothetical protein QQS21_000812 [Conoideocrella luteorostrata]|uniref:Uncharacterized protein n=1 Tax=Conoideocrella luteorostrata TaxID=1105319 RepID=A0AAJ0CZ19_9HYPO|nr:hypothetical protein QQS21_000812 [Conoideocrella luteorostrata]